MTAKTPYGIGWITEYGAAGYRMDEAIKCPGTHVEFLLASVSGDLFLGSFFLDGLFLGSFLGCSLLLGRRFFAS